MGRVTEPAEEQPLAPADMSTPLAPADMSNPITFETAVVTIICEGEREDPDSADRKIDVGHLKVRAPLRGLLHTLCRRTAKRK
jgi:hypothetical protein